MNKCSVEGCNNPVRAKRLCGKHYERVRAHGDVKADFRRKEPTYCQTEGCFSQSVGQGLCAKHYARKLRHGSTDSLIPNYGSHRTVHKQGYIRVWNGYKYVMEHVYLAEKALGKALPLGAIVHHVNENTGDNTTPFNLVVCPDQRYHLLLHKRAREYTAFGKCFSKW